MTYPNQNPIRLAERELIQPFGIREGEPLNPNVRASMPVPRDMLPWLISVVELQVENLRNRSPAHMVLFNTVFERDGQNGIHDNLVSEVARVFDAVMQERPNDDPAQHAHQLSEIIIGYSAESMLPRNQDLVNMCRPEEIDYLQAMAKEGDGLLRSFSQRGGYNRGYGNNYQSRNVQRPLAVMGGNTNARYGGYDRPTSTVPVSDKSSYIPRASAQRPASAPTVAPTPVAPTVQPPAPAAAAVQAPAPAAASARYSAKDWVPTYIQPYKPLYPTAATERFIKDDQGRILSAISEDASEMDYERHAFLMGVKPAIPNEQARKDGVAVIKKAIAETTAKEPEVILSALEETVFVESIDNLSQAALMLLVSQANPKAFTVISGFVGTIVISGQDYTEQVYQLLSSRSFSELHRTFRKYFDTSKSKEEFYSMPSMMVREVDKRITALVNRLLKVEFSIANLSIDSFADDWSDLEQVLDKRSLKDLIIPRIDKDIRSLLGRILTTFPKSEDKEAFVEMISTTSSLIDDAALKSITPKLTILYEPAIVAAMPLLATELDFNVAVDETRLIHPEHHPWLYQISAALCEYKNDKSDTLSRVYMHTVDGYRFELSNALLSAGNYLITRLS